MDEWINLKIVVKGYFAKLYINGNANPSLIVSDLKYGSDISGAIGLWVGHSREGYFRDLRISQT